MCDLEFVKRRRVRIGFEGGKKCGVGGYIGKEK